MRPITLLLCFASRVNGHGYMTQPPSRQYEAYEANGWPNEVAEYDPHGVAAGGMYSECDDCSSRQNYGPNPWSAPGTARAVDFVMGGSGGNMLGVCGASPSRDNDYNQPLAGHWGTEAKTTYKAGDVIDVAWCVSADHGGVPQFRLCDDEGLVSAVTTPGYAPTIADHEALEQCFQRGLLRCDGVNSNTCDQVAECDTYAADWEACADKGKYLHCSGGSPGERGCKNTAETCAHGILARYQLKIPESTKASAHTILSYRWDTYENNEVFVGCADIAITSDGGDAAPVTPRPTPRPTKAPTNDEIDWDCSNYSESCHRIDHNNGDAFKALGTTTSWGSEAVCANKDKTARWSTHWCPKQDLTCTKAKSCRRLDGKSGKMSTTTRWNEAKCIEQGATTRWTTMWCPDQDAPAPTTPRPREQSPTVAHTGHRVVPSVHPGLQDGHRLRAGAAGLHGRVWRRRAREGHHLLPQRKGRRHHVLGRQRGRSRAERQDDGRELGRARELRGGALTGSFLSRACKR